MYNDETTPNQAEKNNPQTDKTQLSPETRDMIKHPPKMDDVLRDLSPDEIRG